MDPRPTSHARRLATVSGMSLRDEFGTDILITGWGHTRFGRLDGESLESLVVAAAGEALASAGVEPGHVDEIVLGHFNSGLVPLGFASSLALQVSDELAHVPATRVENACASGSAAVQQGVKSLLAGTARTVLVIGAEKMTHAPSNVVGAALLGADYELAGQPSTTGFAGLFAEVAKHYEKRHGPVGDTLGSIAAKNHRNGVRNPWAQLRRDLGTELLPHGLGPEPARGRPPATHRLLTRLGRRGSSRPLDAPDRRAGRTGAPRRLRPCERLPACVQAGPARLRRHDGGVAAGDADGGHRPGRSRPPRAARLLHHRRARDL